jgi:hypothetical protein
MVTELEKFERAKNMAQRRGFLLRKALNANDGKRYTLVRHGVETHFATIDEVLVELERV